jgi:hypothetical protein
MFLAEYLTEQLVEPKESIIIYYLHAAAEHTGRVGINLKSTRTAGIKRI